jgi:hypothetical protein
MRWVSVPTPGAVAAWRWATSATAASTRRTGAGGAQAVPTRMPMTMIDPLGGTTTYLYGVICGSEAGWSGPISLTAGPMQAMVTTLPWCAAPSWPCGPR